MGIRFGVPLETRCRDTVTPFHGCTVTTRQALSIWAWLVKNAGSWPVGGVVSLSVTTGVYRLHNFTSQ